MDKACIAKSDSGWTLTRPGYGFHGPTSTPHESQTAAISALYQRNVSGGTGALAESAFPWMLRTWFHPPGT